MPATRAPVRIEQPADPAGVRAVGYGPDDVPVVPEKYAGLPVGDRPRRRAAVTPAYLQGDQTAAVPGIRETMSEIGTIDTIARALTANLPPAWREVTGIYRSTTSYAELDATVDGAQLDLLPEGLEDHFERLRREMYQPGKGTWLTAQVSVTADGHFATDFNYDDEPAWSIPVDRAIYAADLAAFPRDAEHTPDWLT
jgi:hypothetical protein